jgi:rubrerythrin
MGFIFQAMWLESLVQTILLKKLGLDLDRITLREVSAKESLVLEGADMVVFGMAGARWEPYPTPQAIGATDEQPNKGNLSGHHQVSLMIIEANIWWSLLTELQAESPGIISRSIANANAEKSPITPAKGQENVSLLQQQAAKKSSPASTQFTFTCDSQVPGTVSWPGPSSTTTTTMHQSPAIRNLTTQATQTSPNMAAAPHTAEKPKQGLAASQHAPNTQKQSPAPAEPAKKPRRRPAAKEYLIAARQRRHAQQFKNYHNPPAPEDIWICEFCEYERIFGTPPRALIRQYEVKDRRAKKQEAEKRRLLEKAKMKGRKKKGNKAAPKSSQTAQNSQPPQQTQPSSMNQSQSQSQGTQSEEYYEEEYEDDYAQDDPPPPSPVAPPATHRSEAVQSDAGTHSDPLAGGISMETRILPKEKFRAWKRTSSELKIFSSKKWMEGRCSEGWTRQCSCIHLIHRSQRQATKYHFHCVTFRINQHSIERWISIIGAVSSPKYLPFFVWVLLSPLHSPHKRKSRISSNS